MPRHYELKTLQTEARLDEYYKDTGKQEAQSVLAMPVDYSKWDALELSDDSDIEVHPNVDKRSFIRAKQAQIHQDRAQRKHNIQTLKYERIINDGLLTRIDTLLNALNKHLTSSNNENADEIVFQSLIESAGDPSKDQPPPPPEGIHAKSDEQPTYSKMMAALVDQVRKHVEETKPDQRFQSYISEVNVHKNKVLDLQQNLLKELARLEKLEGGKITSESIHMGFDTSHVAKSEPAPKPASTSTTSTSTVELLNASKSTSAGADSHPNEPADSGSEADVEDGEDDAHIEPSAAGKAFGRIKATDYQASLQFIAKHPGVLAEKETDGLLIQAFDAQIAGKSEEARNCVHQALLLQYCRSLGHHDGVAMFFKRIMTKDHQGRKIFYDDVNSTYNRLKERAAEMAKERAEEMSENVEQIQLHAVNPGQKIMISIPSATEPEDAEARKVFDAFPPGLQRALETGELDEVNKVLAKMSVDEAEEVVNQMGGSGMLSMEQGLIDATTEEGRKQMAEIEKTGRMPGSMDEDEMGEPGPQEVDDMD